MSHLNTWNSFYFLPNIFKGCIDKNSFWSCPTQKCKKERAITLTLFPYLVGDDIDYAWRGIMHSHLKRNKEALVDIDQAIKLSPNNSFHHQFRGIIFFGLEKYKKAIEDFSGAIALLPNWAGHYVWRAAVHYELEQWDSTANDLDMAVKLRPDEVIGGLNK